MCGGPAWKREIVPDHKFDFVDTREFRDNGFLMRIKYLWLYAIVFKSFLVYVSDIFSAITMLTTTSWSNQIFNKCTQEQEGCIFIPFSIGKWLFVGCIIFSFLLLAYESRKSKRIIASRDISYAFTNVMANHYYSLRSYDHFCFFDHISNSTKTSDDFAFFVFFVFKSWKRLLLADGPRQTINALTLWAIYLSRRSAGPWYDVKKYFVGNSLSTSALTVSTFFTVIIFTGSLLLLIVAGICYVPLLCYIRGNLKEYCCHKVDKRIGTVIKRRQKQRLADAAKLARKEAMGDYSHLKNKKGEMIAKPLPQPTLPNLSVDDDVDDTSSMNTRVPPPSNHNPDYYYYSSDKSMDYPPMPAYNQPYSNHQDPNAYAQYNPSQVTLGQDDPYYPNYTYDETDSTMNLSTAAAPFGQHPDFRGSPLPNPHGSVLSSNTYLADPHDVYQGRATTPSSDLRRSPPNGRASERPPSSALAYDEEQDYPSPVSPGPPHRSLGGVMGNPQQELHYPGGDHLDYSQSQHRYQSRGRPEYDEEGGGGAGGHYSHAM